MLSQEQMLDLAARLKQATETLGLRWYFASPFADSARTMLRCDRTGHCVGSAILATVVANPQPQYFLAYVPMEHYKAIGITFEDRGIVVGAGDDWMEDCDQWKGHELQYSPDVPVLRAMFLEAVGLNVA